VFESNSKGLLRQRLEKALHHILSRPRDPEILRQNVLEMHTKIVEHHKPRDCWHVKHIRGGMVDIEFIAQYLQLRHAAAFPRVLQRGTIASLQALHEAGVLSNADCLLLVETYTLWRNIQNLLRLTFGKVSPEDRASESLVRKLCILCGVETFAGVKGTIEAKAKDIWRVFERVV
jgi:glutamate-ammonia-ligase adenylyltransferase